jgi:hypothetical protein
MGMKNLEGYLMPGKIGRPLKPDKRISTSLSLDPEVIAIIDRERGEESRSSWLNDLILDRFGGENI